MATDRSLALRWKELSAGIAEDVSDKWWETIEQQYETPGRHYHNLQHLEDMFVHFESCKANLQSPDMVAYAIFFHDLIYNPKSADTNEEESVESFRKFASEGNIAKDSQLYNDVVHLILLTKTHLTEEHKQSGVYGDKDFHYFLDFDMAILGSQPEVYDDYALKIRQEYRFLNDDTYTMLRSKVLKNFIQIPSIFATECFRSKYESSARSNIKREIESLEGKI